MNCTIYCDNIRIGINIINSLLLNKLSSITVMSQNIKFKIKQFQWFQMQTKVRQIIQQVLGPIQKRILQSSALINKLKSSQADDQLRIQQISLMIANDPKVFETGVFATVDRKFMQQAMLIEELSRQIEEENKYVENKFKILDLRMEESSQVLKNIASLKQRVTRQMQLQNDNINSLRMNIQKMIEDLNGDIRETRKNIVDKHEKSEKRDSALQEEIRRIKQNILTIEDTLQLHREMHQEKTTQLEEHQRNIDKHNGEIKDLFENKNLTKRLGDYVEDMDSEIKKVLFKVDSISPLITQAQISQCLQAILPPRLKNKISIYQHRRYYQLNKQVLQRDYKNVQNKLNGLQLLQTRQRTITRQIIQLKRKKLIQQGIDIDHATYQQRQRHYNQLSLQDEFNVEFQQQKVSQQIDEGDIKKILTRFLAEYMEQFKEKIGIEIGDNKRYIYSVEEEIRHQVGKFTDLMATVQRQCAAFHTDHLLQAKLQLNQQKFTEANLKSLEQKLHQLTELQRLFYNFCSLMNHLSIQDEIDKQNISLLGTKQSSPDQYSQSRNSVIALDGKCFSCNGYPATTLTAFKMACLAYHPSAIRIDTKQYRREELLEFTTNMLQMIKKHVQTNNNNNIKTQEAPKHHIQTESQQNLSRDNSPAHRIKSLTVNPYNPHQKGSFKNSFISKHLETQLSHGETADIQASKYRKKTLTTTYSSSYSKRKHSLKKAMMHEEMLKTNVIFNSLKKKNQTFLS